MQEVVAPVHAVPVEKEKSPVPLGDPFFADDNGDDSDFDLCMTKNETGSF